MESLRGHAFRRIQMSQTGLFLYVAKRASRSGRLHLDGETNGLLPLLGL
jgi:hypothetical protein